VNLLEKRKNSSHAHKTGSLYLLGAVFKISDKQPGPFFYGSSPGFTIKRRIAENNDKVEIVTISLGIKHPQKLGQATGNLLQCAV